MFISFTCYQINNLRTVFTIIVLLVAFHSRAQTVSGTVMSGETKLPLSKVTIFNLNSVQSTTTNKQGVFFITAKPGDSLSFSIPGYHMTILAATPDGETDAELWPISFKLPAYTVTNLSAYQRDSLEMATLYSHELNKKAIKVGFSSANGGGFTGLIGRPVQKLSKSYKQNKRFKENFKKDQEQKFIDTRYTPALVGSLTGLAGDTLIMFMNTHPMEHEFARHATELELKAWVRAVYKEYLHSTVTIQAK
jgi:hypothetical protein